MTDIPSLPEAASALDTVPELATGIRLFVEEMAAAYAAHPPFASLSIAARRCVVEAVRAPWVKGGPSMATTRTIAPGGQADPPVPLRVHKPAADTGATRGALAYVHGGGWALFSLETHDRVMREYAARSGMTVIGIDYGLVPEVRFPVALEQIAGTLSWIEANRKALGLVDVPLFLGGDSAGANMSVAAALLARDRDEALPAGLVLNYGAFDPACDRPSFARFGSAAFMLTAPEMLAFWEGYVARPEALRDPLVGVLHADLHGLPPCLIAVAEYDVVHDENLAMAEALKAAGVDVTCKVYPGTMHSFLEAAAVAPIAIEAFDDTATWLTAQAARRGRG